jgi:NADH-quinone oxidoreductase subunit C
MSDENKREEEGAVPAAESVVESQREAAPEPVAEATPESAPESVAEPKVPQSAEATPASAVETSSSPTPEAADPTAPAPRKKETDEEKAARRKAAFEAREAAKVAAAQAAAQAPPTTAPAAQAGNEGSAAPKSGADGEQEEQPVKEPSVNQPRLDRAAALLRELIAEDCVEEAYINEPNDHLPTLVVKNEHWLQAAQLFRNHVELSCNYLRNVSGVDYETHMEVVYYPLNMDSRECYCLKVRTDREQPSVPSVTPIWETANWNEREIYDLLGIDFPGHPDLRRIMMSDDWVGHPLRKDYVPLDPEV